MAHRRVNAKVCGEEVSIQKNQFLAGDGVVMADEMAVTDDENRDKPDQSDFDRAR